MSFENSCGDIWNFKLSKSNRAEALLNADFLREEYEIKERGVNKFTEFGFKTLFSRLGASNDKDAKESLCNSIMRLFT